MKRLLKRLLTTLVVLSAAFLATVYFTLRGSLPPLDGEHIVDGLGAAVTIERDAAGVTTVIADSRADLAFGTGFAHAQDRYFQMDLTRRKAAGELSALVGEAALALDRRSRLHRFRARATEAIRRMSDVEQTLLAAYVAGVNAGLGSLSARPFEYFVLQSEPAPWVAEDTLLVVYAMYMELNDERAARDVQRGFARLSLPAEVFDWLYPAGTSWDAPLVGDAVPGVVMPAADVFDLRRTTANGDGATIADSAVGESTIPGPSSADPNIVDTEGLMPGSNNWAVAGALTDSGRAIVANDMHLGITTPNVFYRARLVQRGDSSRDVSGVTLPGAPVVVAGSNGHIAWGFTNSYGDWSDAVLLVPGDGDDTYRTPEGEQRIENYAEEIAVRDGASETLLVRETRWGPIDDDVDYPAGDIAVSWVAHAAAGVNIVQLELETAASVEEALGVANRVAIPPQNFVVGDSAGNIAWTIAGRIPARGPAPALLPADWSTGAGWSGWVAADGYPRIVNPPSGRIWTANTRVVNGSALEKIGDGGYDLGARGGQIRDGLMARERFSPTDMLAIHLDDRALFLARWRDLLLDVLDDDNTREIPGRAEYRQLVQDWVPRASADSVGYRLVKAFRTVVRERAFLMLAAPIREAHGDDVPMRISNQFEGPLWQLVSEQPAHLLSAEYEDWPAFLLAAVDYVISDYDERYENGIAARTWGELNTASIRHPLSRALPWLSDWLDMPAEPLSGDGNMPRVQGPDFGASERFAVSPGAEATGYLHMPAGQSGHPLSDYYRQGHDDWVQGRASPFLPGASRHVLELRPRT